MLIWGSHGKVSDLGQVETKHCENCEKERSFKLMLHYRVSHIWYLFKWVSSKQYLMLCDVCSRGTKLDSKSVEPTLAKNPIPFSSRYGWTFLVGAIAAMILFGVATSYQNDSHDAELLSEPRANDTYVVNIATFLKNPNAAYMYGVMKVRAMNGGNAEVALSNVSHSKLTGATQDIAYGRAEAESYFSANTITLPVTQLQAMRANGTMYRAYRN